jgi:hypothetical protein
MAGASYRPVTDDSSLGSVRCGQFTGTFNFRVTICTIRSFIPVDCANQ